MVCDTPMLPPHAGRFAVEDGVSHGKIGDGRDDRGVRRVLWEPVTGEQLHAGALLEGEQPDAVELSLERPLVSRESFGGERSRHGLEPIRKGRHAPFCAVNFA
jgi:hypothetical protein